MHFLLSPAPLRNTLVDFWRMIWQEEVHTVVMVSNDMKPNSPQYWPRNGTDNFGPFKVTLNEETLNEQSIVRCLQLEVSLMKLKVLTEHS